MEPLLVFYDGGCGLCHRAVRLLLRADETGQAFRFAPLGGATFESLVAPEQRQRLPDSLVVRTHDGRLLVRSTGVVCALGRLGVGWRAAAVVMGWVPRPVRDAAYDVIARIRFRLFARPAEACPIIPPVLRDRFLP
jgi:predicted DCC family thiol-disulfide oxidoreductase YuxK